MQTREQKIIGQAELAALAACARGELQSLAPSHASKLTNNKDTTVRHDVQSKTDSQQAGSESWSFGPLLSRLAAKFCEEPKYGAGLVL